MNILFSGRNYEKLFHYIYDNISSEYDLIIKKIDETSMSIGNDIFELIITYDLDTSWIYYKNKKNDRTYLISNYINTNAEDEDKTDIKNKNDMLTSIENTMVVQAKVIERKFGDLLCGGTKWFIEYQRSPFFLEV